MSELNVQNGVLKALSFLFEYIGEMGKDYIYSGEPSSNWMYGSIARSVSCWDEYIGEMGMNYIYSGEPSSNWMYGSSARSVVGMFTQPGGQGLHLPG